MRTIRRAVVALVATAVLFVGYVPSTTHAATGDLTKQQTKQLQKQFNQIVKQHKQSLNSLFKSFKKDIAGVTKDVNSGTADPFQVFDNTNFGLDVTFDSSISSTRSSIGQFESTALGFYQNNTGVPDSVPELSADPDSLLAAAVKQLNAENAKTLNKIRKLMAKLEQAACKQGIPLFCNLRGVPTFQSPHVTRSGTFGSGMTEGRASITFTTSGGDGPSRLFSVMGFFDFDPTDDDTPWVGLFEADGSEIHSFETTPSPNGTFRGTFSTSSPGIKNVAVDIFDPDDELLIFADGFESGDTSAWSR